jgi:hypothetical protein
MLPNMCAQLVVYFVKITLAKEVKIILGKDRAE